MRLVSLLAALTSLVLAAPAPAPASLKPEPAATEGGLRVPLRVDWPAGPSVERWPITTGVPFRRGERSKADGLAVVDEHGRALPSQIRAVATWPDGSLRWVHVDFAAERSGSYLLTSGKSASHGDGQRKEGSTRGPDDLRVERFDRGLRVRAGRAEYTFSRDRGFFERLAYDVGRDGRSDGAGVIASGAGEGFYIVDSRGRRAVLAGRALEVELEGPRRVVIRQRGDYLVDGGESLASGVVYYTFHAGFDHVRISHKLILTRDMNELAFREIGLAVPLSFGDGARDVQATFNDDHGDPRSAFTQALSGKRELVMVQDDFPHFGSSISQFRLLSRIDGAEELVRRGAAAGDWADVSSARSGLAAQVPAFAEQFPTAFVASARGLKIELWASEAGRDLDLRTEVVMDRYFGHDWVPKDAKANKLPNVAAGTAKTHEIWLYPHGGAYTPALAGTFGATREEIFAAPDPEQVARSEVMGPIHPRDVARFAEAEASIESEFARVLASQRVFPANGYLYYGAYPYVAQPWEQKSGRWYPTIDRLARGLEYNLKRGVWLLYGRSGERQYFDYARRYTRFLHDLAFSNADAPLKPKGWVVQGYFHSPIMWGQFTEAGLKSARTKKRNPGFSSEASCLAIASSEDVIQFVYDYFLTGDLHSRDMARTYTEAVVAATGLDPDAILRVNGSRPEAFLRMFGSAYDLEHDARILKLSQGLLARMVLPSGDLNTEVKAQYGKRGELYSAYYYYWVSTGEALAEKALVRLAEFEYRAGGVDDFFARSSPLLQAFSLAARAKKRPIYGEYAADALRRVPSQFPTLESLGLDPASVNQATTGPWGQKILTRQSVVDVGVPVAERAALELGRAPRPLPLAVKPEPTEQTWIILEKRERGPLELDVYVNNVGDRRIEPRLSDLTGRGATIEVVERDAHREPVQDLKTDPAFSQWYGKTEEQIFFRLRLPASVAPGVYRLDLGREVAFEVLDAGTDRIAQLAPNGLVIRPRERSYLLIPPGRRRVEYFAALPIEVSSPSGEPIASEALGEGRYRFETDGTGGILSIVRRDRIATFFRLESDPTLIALGTASRMVPVAPASLARLLTQVAPPAPPQRASNATAQRGPPPSSAQRERARPEREEGAARERAPDDEDETTTGGEESPEAAPPSTSARSRAPEGAAARAGAAEPRPARAKPFSTFDGGVFASGLRLFDRFVELPLARAPSDQAKVPLFSEDAGTVEFFWRPGWSATDFDFENATARVQLLRADPVVLSYSMDPDLNRSGHYGSGYLVARVADGVACRGKLLVERDRWYHVAATWKTTGEEVACELFVDGRRREHQGKLTKKKRAPDAKQPIPAPADFIRFGSAHARGGGSEGEDYDELRVSNVVRYTGDFDPPSRPFVVDPATCLLMHLDGDLRAEVGSETRAGELKTGKRLN